MSIADAHADRAPDPLTRALALARGLRSTFLLDETDLWWLLNRWARLNGLTLQPQALRLLVRLVIADDARPLTVAGAQRIADQAAEDFAEVHEARRAARNFALLMGAEAEQCVRLDRLVREAWYARHLPGVAVPAEPAAEEEHAAPAPMVETRPVKPSARKARADAAERAIAARTGKVAA